MLYFYIPWKCLKAKFFWRFLQNGKTKNHRYYTVVIIWSIQTKIKRKIPIDEGLKL